MGVIDPEAADKAMDASTQSMRHLSTIGIRLWKMWREVSWCHGMTFSDLSFHPFTSSFIVLGLISLLLLIFTLWT